MAGNTTMRGEKIYDMELDLTGVTDYGVSLDAILAGKEAIALHGARFDLAVDGRYEGRLAGRAHGATMCGCAPMVASSRPAPDHRDR